MIDVISYHIVYGTEYSIQHLYAYYILLLALYRPTGQRGVKIDLTHRRMLLIIKKPLIIPRLLFQVMEEFHPSILPCWI